MGKDRHLDRGAGRSTLSEEENKGAKEMMEKEPSSTYTTPVTWLMKGHITSVHTHKSEELTIKINRSDVDRMQDYSVSEHVVRKYPEKIGKYVEGSLRIDYEGKRRVPPEGMKLVDGGE